MKRITKAMVGRGRLALLLRVQEARPARQSALAARRTGILRRAQAEAHADNGAPLRGRPSDMDESMNTQHNEADAIKRRQLERIEAMLAATRYAWLIEHATVEQRDTGAVWAITVPCGDADYVEDAINAAMRKERAARKQREKAFA